MSKCSVCGSEVVDGVCSNESCPLHDLQVQRKTLSEIKKQKEALYTFKSIAEFNDYILNGTKPEAVEKLTDTATPTLMSLSVESDEDDNPAYAPRPTALRTMLAKVRKPSAKFKARSVKATTDESKTDESDMVSDGIHYRVENRTTLPWQTSEG